MTVRWTFTDLTTSEVWQLTYNPNTMTSPHAMRNTLTSQRSPIDGHVRALRQQPTPKDWSFGGVIRSEEHYETLLEWVDRGHLVHLADHLGRVFLIRLIQFIPAERRPMLNVPWRFTYEMKAVVYRRVS